MVKVYIDAGHGGSDSGAVGNGLKEKDLTLQIAKGIYNKLKNYNVSLRMSRSTDKTLSLKQRTDDANKWGANLFISIHINAGGGSGYEDYIYLRTPSITSDIQKAFNREIIKQIKVKNRGSKRQNFHVLRESKMDAVLTENLFIDNKDDARRLKKKDFIDRIIDGHVNAIVKFYGLKSSSKSKPKPKPKSEKGHYRVVAGSFSNKEYAEKRVKELSDKGFDSFIAYYKN